jgi:hypothetical protein
MHLPKLLAAACCLTLSFSALRAEDPATFEVGALKFSRPATWTWVPVSSPMRKAQLKIAGADGQSAEVTFFHFGPGMGGGVAANATRWTSQFQSKEGVAKIEPQEIGGAKVTLVSTEGTFNSGMPGAGSTTPLENYALLGAIIENPEGDVFIKMTGPAALIKEQKKAFLDFIASAVAPRK